MNGYNCMFHHLPIQSSYDGDIINEAANPSILTLNFFCIKILVFSSAHKIHTHIPHTIIVARQNLAIHIIT